MATTDDTAPLALTGFFTPAALIVLAEGLAKTGLIFVSVDAGAAEGLPTVALEIGRFALGATLLAAAKVMEAGEDGPLGPEATRFGG